MMVNLRKKYNRSPYFFALALMIGAGLAVGASVWATSVGTDVSVSGNLAASKITTSSTSASSSVSYALGVGTSTPGIMFSVGGAAGNTTGHGYFTGGVGIGIATTTSGALETTGAAKIAGVLNVGGIANFNAAADFDSTAQFNSTATMGSSGVAVSQISHGFCDFGPIVASQTIAASSTGAVACTSQIPTGLAAGDKIWLTASSTTATALQNTGGAANIIVGANYVFTGLASSTTVGGALRIQALVYNLGLAAWTVTTSSWQYLLIK